MRSLLLLLLLLLLLPAGHVVAVSPDGPDWTPIPRRDRLRLPSFAKLYFYAYVNTGRRVLCSFAIGRVGREKPDTFHPIVW